MTREILRSVRVSAPEVGRFCMLCPLLRHFLVRSQTLEAIYGKSSLVKFACSRVLLFSCSLVLLSNIWVKVCRLLSLAETLKGIVFIGIYIVNSVLEEE
jgi:hypothetical protein